ncbi:MAG: competence/damage-inducible protein A [Oscillospiraceae bacterium]|nr:competence/damage-inducible protein A [Oscillospiraceae bacterium]MBR0450941.1 competence/damage-inducible protein A [Oscillospiraceae bacterium]
MSEKKLIAEIIAVGDEVLSGRIQDTNSSYLASGLQKLGFQVAHRQVVGDSEREIYSALKIAASRSNVIVFSGGLGPTKDDLTKETVAKSFDKKLVLDESVLEEIEEFFKSRGITPRQNNRKQAYVPEGSIVLHNVNGTAPGIILRKGRQAVVLLPGPPSELRPLFDDCATPYLKEMTNIAQKEASLMVIGIPESELETKIQDLLYGDNPYCALYAQEGTVEIHISAYADTEEEAEKLLTDKLIAFKSLLGDAVYADSKMEISEAVVNELLKNKKTVAVAESCTGGMVSQQITAVAGSSACYEYGATTYADWTKNSYLDINATLLNKYTAVSSVVAVEMARGIRKKGKADFGVGVTGIAGPGKGNYLDKEVGQVYIAVCDKKKAVVKEFNFGDKRSRENIRVLSAKNTFDMLRRFMESKPIEGGKEYTSSQIANMNRTAEPRTKAGIMAKKVVSIVAALGILFGGSTYASQRAAASSDRAVYQDLNAVYTEEYEADPGEALDNILNRNEDAIGWLFGANGEISTPVVRARQDDYYEDHDFLKNNNQYGCAYALEETPLDGAAENIVITASKEGKGILFSNLPNYLQQRYASRNRFFSFQSRENKSTYEVYSVFLLDKYEGIDGYIFTPTFRDEVAFRQFVISTKMRSIYSTDLPLSFTDRFLTLVCPMDQEWEGCKLVVVARKVQDSETTRATALSMNGSALYPAAWYEKNGIECNVNITAESDKWMDWYEEGGKIGQNIHTDDEELLIQVEINGNVLEDTPLEIISRIVTEEVTNNNIKTTETIKALAVATATELKYSFLNEEKIPSYAGRAATDTVRAAVSEVLDETLMYDGEVCWAPMFTCSSGNTNDASEMVEGDYPYLVSVDSAYDSKEKDKYYNQTDVLIASLKSRIEEIYGIELSDDRDDWIRVIESTKEGYATKVMVDNQLEVDGYEFFVNVLDLPSANVIVALNNNSFRFTIYGTGYGLGMSVVGAKYFASIADMDYKEILEHYYPGVQIQQTEWNTYYGDNVNA